MRASLLYPVFLAAAVGLSYGIIQYGKRLVAPAALPRAWQLTAEGAAGDCPIFPSGSTRLALSQSGETISVTLSPPVAAELHGKLGRDGNFRLAGQVPRGRLLDCRGGKLVWIGTATPQAIAGMLTLSGDACKTCPNPIRLQGNPEP